MNTKNQNDRTDNIPDEPAEFVYQNILKKILLVFIGSGLITNALYIYGLAYYEGYIENLGFEFGFFPIKWNDTLIWTYVASREIGANTVNFWTKLTGPAVLFILVATYFIARAWMTLNALEARRKKESPYRSGLARILVPIRKRYPRAFGLIYPPVKWLLIMEQSIWAFLVSYFVLIFLFFIPLFIFIWVYFPLIGLHHGEEVGEKKYEQYQSDLCGDESDYWIKCVSFSTRHLKDKSLPDKVYGRVILKQGNLVGIITKDGPITITMPPLFYQKAQKNKCYKVKCDKDSKIKGAQKLSSNEERAI
ncbi:hypothetical protein [Pseudoalteromonas sp. R3]|uniref:hypothetical protein n=1 Tax=Pseudoalteromonas sp. R3 TaxID=1709477 RepID=UPI0006B5BBDF|nr:hypothetical protein [Pseudoalteromonas sp. R3]AZZ98794.1 hypothetical protein ELR70_17820 [Pseudoalteromonas sp. R3]